MKDLPALPYAEWRPTRDTLHRWAQIVGKIRLHFTPLVNHWWNVPLYLSAHGLTTSSFAVDDRRVELELDFVEDVLRIRVSDVAEQRVELRPRSVADFYAATMAALRRAGIECAIWTTPVECANPIPFERDEEHHSYDRAYVMRFWDILSRVDAVLTKFRAGFIGKSSPVHFFWGSFDLAVTRFSGRRAPPFDASGIEREAYSHEVHSVGWWPGDERFEKPAFYSYAAPEPAGYASATIAPAQAYYHAPLKGFYLDHDDVRRAPNAEAMLLEFFTTTYVAAANLGNWPRLELERGVSKREDDHANLYSSGDYRERSSADEGLRGVSEAGR